MRREELYLSDIVEAADAIAAFLSGCSRAAFLQDDLLRSAVLHKLSIIGEAAARVALDFRERHPQIEWVRHRGISQYRGPCVFCGGLVHSLGCSNTGDSATQTASAGHSQKPSQRLAHGRVILTSGSCYRDQ